MHCKKHAHSCIYMLHSVHGHDSVCGHALYRALYGHRVAIHGHRQLCATAGHVVDPGGIAWIFFWESVTILPLFAVSSTSCSEELFG